VDETSRRRFQSLNSVTSARSPVGTPSALAQIVGSGPPPRAESRHRRHQWRIVDPVISTTPVADWIKRIADDERRRDTLRIRDDETAARQAALVRRNGRRLLDDLRATVTRDVEAFRNEFAGDAGRDVMVETHDTEGGFVVRKPAPTAVSLTVIHSPEAAALVCRYRFTLTNGLPPREDRIDVLFSGDSGETIQMKHHGTGQVFTTAEALSELLLVPVLTGRPR
jgi:hypothetical protein